MKSTTGLLLFLALALPKHTVLLADPNFRLQDGGTVIVDPDTNRATVTQDGVTTPLWDGTHRMQDGSILIINQGISVPGEPAPSPPQKPLPEAEKWEGAPIAGYSPCEKLTRRVCGKENQCGETQGCDLAQQLLGMEQKERAASKNRNRMTYTSGQCQTMASDAETFPLCAQQNN